MFISNMHVKNHKLYKECKLGKLRGLLYRYYLIYNLNFGNTSYRKISPIGHALNHLNS
jgi:hypothetical protein